MTGYRAATAGLSDAWGALAEILRRMCGPLYLLTFWGEAGQRSPWYPVSREFKKRKGVQSGQVKQRFLGGDTRER